MVTTESVTIKVPVGMSKYLVTMNPGIRKSELIDLYDKLGYSYFDMTMDDLDDELNTFRELKKKEAAV